MHINVRDDICYYIFKRNESDFMIQNLILSWLAPISSPKMKNQKARMPFLVALFHFETNLIKKTFSLFSGPFWTDGKFFLSRSEAEQLAGSDKKTFWLTNLFPRVPSFYIRTKLRLKNHLTTVYLLLCKTKLFIYLCFWGRNLRQINEHPSWEVSINTKKKGFFVFFTFVYIV